MGSPWDNKKSRNKGKHISVGIVIINDHKILGCEAFGNRKFGYDLPKGKQEPGESFLDTAMRECYEEIGINLSINKLVYLGQYAYRKNKDLVLYKTQEVIDITKCNCISTFEFNGNQVPEMINYKWIDDVSEFYPALRPILSTILL